MQFLTQCVRDARQSFRGLRAAPLTAVLVVITLGLGTGANSAVFSAVQGVLLEPLPWSDPDRLVEIRASRGGESGRISVAELEDVRRDLADLLVDVAFYNGGGSGYTIAEGPRPEEPPAILNSGNLFDVLGVELLHGTSWPPADDRARSYSVVLSYELWQRQFAGDPAAIGASLTLDGAPLYTVFGVMPPGMDFPSGTDIYRSSFFTNGALDYDDRSDRRHVGVARLRADVTPAVFQAALNQLASRLEAEHPTTNQGIAFESTALREIYVGNVQPFLLLLFGAATLVLVVACVNVASLLLARGLERERELAVRLALGAGRSDVVRALLVESIMLGTVGAALGWAICILLTSRLISTIAVDLPSWMHIEPDLTVLAFSLVIGVICGVAVGLLPAWRLSRGELAGNVVSGARGASTGRRELRWRAALIIAEVMLAFVLVVSAGLMVKSFDTLLASDPGFRTERLLTFRVYLTWYTYRGDDHLPFVQDVIRELEAVPGVDWAASNGSLPQANLDRIQQREFTLDGQNTLQQATNPFAIFQVVSPGYLDRMQIPLLEGRLLGESDTAEGEHVAVVSASLAERAWPGESAIGQLLHQGGPNADEPAWLRVVGVVDDVRYRSLADDRTPTVYQPITQFPIPNNHFVVATHLDPESLTNAVAEAVWRVDPFQAVHGIHTMEHHVLANVWQRRLARALFGWFALLAGSLAATGIYGVIATTVRQRRRELGTRLALGALPGQVLRLVVADGLRLALVGVGLGVLLSAATSWLLESLLFGTTAIDLATLAGAAMAMVGLAAVAAALPAWQASRVEPTRALKAD